MKLMMQQYSRRWRPITSRQLKIFASLVNQLYGALYLQTINQFKRVYFPDLKLDDRMDVGLGAFAKVRCTVQVFRRTKLYCVLQEVHVQFASKYGYEAPEQEIGPKQPMPGREVPVHEATRTGANVQHHHLKSKAA